MKNKLAYLFALFALPVLANTPPEITNVRASQREGTKLVDIYYDAADADGDLLKIRVEISDNDGVKYSVPAFSLTGDIGEGIATGVNKHIIWDAGTDWDGEYSDQMRVKVFAIDARGFPGMEWGNEVPPGGFLMGQDGGAEGSGPSRHVNIPWSYWLSKYEITAEQYCEFLNSALAAGWVKRIDTTAVELMPRLGKIPGLNQSYTLLSIGDDQDIRWNVNNFEVVNSRTNHPAKVSLVGAMVFARYYGYDLPTEAEWEKAARGPANDDQDEHLVYPWGDEISIAYAKGYEYSSPGTKTVGYYDGSQTPMGPDTINGYGLYDVIGNLSEWTRSILSSTTSGIPAENYAVQDYPQEENLAAIQHSTEFDVNQNAYTFVVRGGGADNGDTITSESYKLYYRQGKNTGSRSGFRVVRRSEQGVESAKCSAVINFADGNAGSLISAYRNDFATFKTAYEMSASSHPVTIQTYTDAHNETKHLVQISNNTLQMTLKNLGGDLQFVKFKMSGDTSYCGARLSCDDKSYGSARFFNSSIENEYTLVANPNAKKYVLEFYSTSSSSYYIARVTDIELYVTPHK